MIAKPATKYQPIAPIALADRQWPNRSITRAPSLFPALAVLTAI